MSKKTEELTKSKKEGKTYSAKIVRDHINMSIEMVKLAKNWHMKTVPIDKIDDVNKIVEMIKREFLEEFKNAEFYYYLDQIETALRR